MYVCACVCVCSCVINNTIVEVIAVARFVRSFHRFIFCYLIFLRLALSSRVTYWRTLQCSAYSIIYINCCCQNHVVGVCRLALTLIDTHIYTPIDFGVYVECDTFSLICGFRSVRFSYTYCC